jgi:predicted nucleic acid-binding Zn ribbon protein
VLFGATSRWHETEVIEAWSKIVGEFIAAHSAPIALREGILYVHVLQPALHYELEQVSKSEILRKLKQRFGGEPFATSASAWAEPLSRQI